QRSLEVFLDKLADLEGDERRELKSALGQADTLEVRSAFDLDEQQRRRIGQALAELLDGEPDMEFNREPKLILGLEVRVPGRKLAWSMDEYLGEMEQQLVERLAQALNSGKARQTEADAAQEEAGDA
ncbi:MAG: F0F1 ATP synthase subunit delta, partial [Desulfarculaceae bacterium]|nr:F0F1 ATP synthase subunit delta [Desulfarculaceae bacterium]